MARLSQTESISRSIDLESAARAHLTNGHRTTSSSRAAQRPAARPGQENVKASIPVMTGLESASGSSKRFRSRVSSANDTGKNRVLHWKRELGANNIDKNTTRLLATEDATGITSEAIVLENLFTSVGRPIQHGKRYWYSAIITTSGLGLRTPILMNHCEW